MQGRGAQQLLALASFFCYGLQDFVVNFPPINTFPLCCKYMKELLNSFQNFAFGTYIILSTCKVGISFKSPFHKYTSAGNHKEKYPKAQQKDHRKDLQLRSSFLCLLQGSLVH